MYLYILFILFVILTIYILNYEQFKIKKINNKNYIQKIDLYNYIKYKDNQSLYICNKPLKSTTLYMKIHTFLPSPIYVYSYINSNCILNKKGIILTNIVNNTYSKIPILYEPTFKYVWVALQFNVSRFNENIKFVILDVFKEFDGFYLFTNENNYIVNDKMILQNFNKTKHKKEYVQYNIYNDMASSTKHILNINLTNIDTNIRSLHIRLKYSK